MLVFLYSGLNHVNIPGRSRDGIGVPDPRSGTGWYSVSRALSFSVEGEASLLLFPLVWLCVGAVYVLNVGAWLGAGTYLRSQRKQPLRRVTPKGREAD